MLRFKLAFALPVLVVALASESQAQAALLGPGAAYFGIGVARTDNAHLDQRLSENGYPTFGESARTVNLGGYRLLSSNVMAGAELNGLIWGEHRHAGNDVGLGGGYGTLGGGYMFMRSHRVRVYPRVGIGAGGLGLWIDNESDSIPFNDVLANPRSSRPDSREPVLNRSGFVLDLGGGAELLKGKRSGVMAGVRAGYVLASFGKHWTFSDRKVSGGPDASISGFYVLVILGGAWSR